MHDRKATLKEMVVRRGKRTTYSELWALRDVSFDVAPGEAVGIIGRNGSGKSTLLKILAGIIPPQSGSVTIGGTVASLLELGSGFHPDFTGRENVYMNGAIYGLSESEVKDRMDEIVHFAEIPDFIDMPVRTYSSGMQMRLAFSVAAHVNPDVLLLDEVLAVGDEAFQRKCMARIFEFRRGGGTLVFVSHDPASVAQVCDRTILMANGQVELDSTPEEGLRAYHELLTDGHARVGGVVHGPAIEDTVPAPSAPELAAPAEAGPAQSRVSVDSVAIGKTSEGTAALLLAGDPFSVLVDLTINSPGGIVVSMWVVGVDGTTYFGTNSWMWGHRSLGDTAGPISLEFAIEHLPLNNGHFDVWVQVTSVGDDEVLALRDRAASFEVFSRGLGIGTVEIERWTVRAGDRVGAASFDLISRDEAISRTDPRLQ